MTSTFPIRCWNYVALQVAGATPFGRQITIHPIIGRLSKNVTSLHIKASALLLPATNYGTTNYGQRPIALPWASGQDRLAVDFIPNQSILPVWDCANGRRNLEIKSEPDRYHIRPQKVRHP
jgi:hypothetical protein